MFLKKNDFYRIALIRADTLNNPHSTNAERFIKFLQFLSKNTLQIDHLNDVTIRSGEAKIDWKKYAGVISETSFSPKELFDLGIQKEQLIACGNYNAMVNKGVFALLFDESLHAFWEESLGSECFNRLKNILIPTRFINSEKELEEARAEGKVVKVSWAGVNTLLINRSRGVAMPNEELAQGTQERWDSLKSLISQGVRIIAQDFVMPKKIPAFLRKKGTSLEPVEWHNRVCVKYVASDNPNLDATPEVFLTATEVTLGPDIIPAGRKCAFTAGAYL